MRNTAYCTIVWTYLIASGCDSQEEGKSEQSIAVQESIRADAKAENKPSLDCGRLEPVACHEVAQKLRFGRDASAVDRSAAAQRLEENCARGYAPSCNSLGEMLSYRDGRKDEPDRARVATLIEKACDGGDPQGCVNLSQLHKLGAGLPKDKEKAHQYFDRAIALFEKDCEAGSSAACLSLGSALSGEGVVPVEDESGAKRRYARAFELATKECEAGQAEGCGRAGTMLGNGQGVDKKLGAARVLFEKGCELGDAASCGSVGSMIEHGQGGGTPDPARALKFYERSCLGGEGAGCFSGGLLRKNSGGPVFDEQEALRLYSLGCAHNHAGSCVNLGVMHLNGEAGLPRDKAKAREFYDRACERNAQVGCNNLKHLSAELRRDEAASGFRDTLSVGDQSHCGLVVEVKAPIAKVQTMIGEVWLRIDQLHRAGEVDCRFRNGVYQDP